MPMATHDSLAQCRADARRQPLQTLPHELVPQDQEAAFAVQHQTLALLKQDIAGWKVGAKSVDGPIQGAPLPADRPMAFLAAGVVEMCVLLVLAALEPWQSAEAASRVPQVVI